MVRCLKISPSMIAVALGFLVSASLSFGQTGTPNSAESFMTPDEIRATGVMQLSPQQRAQLFNWLKRIAGQMYEKGVEDAKKQQARTDSLAPRHESAEYFGSGGGHWIRDNADGKIITLEDGSLWQIEEIDQIDTSLWLPITNITVLRSTSPIGDYKYVLLDKDDGEKALAKYLGRE